MRCVRLREYLAILLQEMGWFAAARRLRRSPPRSVQPPVAFAARQGKAKRGAASAAQPYVVDTATERHLQFTADALQSRMLLDDPYALISAYTRQMMSFLLFAPDPVHVLMIGLGGGSLPKFCYRHLPATQITVVEIDARVIALRDSFHVPPDDARFRVICDDGARYISQLGGRVDAILIDAFDAAGVAPSLATSDFFSAAARHLTADGVLIMNLYGAPQRYAAHVEKVRAAFGGRALIAPVTAHDNVLLVACNAAAPAPTARELDVRARYLQSRFRLQFESYLQRIRNGRIVAEQPAGPH